MSFDRKKAYQKLQRAHKRWAKMCYQDGETGDISDERQNQILSADTTRGCLIKASVSLNPSSVTLLGQQNQFMARDAQFPALLGKALEHAHLGLWCLQVLEERHDFSLQLNLGGDCINAGYDLLLAIAHDQPLDRMYGIRGYQRLYESGGWGVPYGDAVTLILTLWALHKRFGIAFKADRIPAILLPLFEQWNQDATVQQCVHDLLDYHLMCAVNQGNYMHHHWDAYPEIKYNTFIAAGGGQAYIPMHALAVLKLLSLEGRSVALDHPLLSNEDVDWFLSLPYMPYEDDFTKALKKLLV